MTIKLTTTQKDNFKEELRFVSSFKDSKDDYLAGKAEVAAVAIPQIFESISCSIDDEFDEEKWNYLKNSVEFALGWDAKMARYALRGGQEDKHAYFSGRTRAYEWLLNVLNTVEKGEDLPSWAM